MKTSKIVLILLFSIYTGSLSFAQVKMNFDFDTPYGKNEFVGKYVTVNGISMYYEEYGKGEPILLIHGNGGNIKSMGNQIDYFKNKYRVIIADSRGHGQSELNTDSLTYDQIAKDLSELVNHLNIDSVNIVGWSDGGVIGLLIGINHPSKFKKIVVAGTNLRSDSTTFYPYVIESIKESQQHIDAMIQENDTTQNWILQKQQLGLLLYQPNISKSDLSKIKIPVLIIAGDKDLIREEHSVEIYQNIRKAQLCILPGETHFVPASNPDVFNKTVEKFIVEPFSRPDSDWTKW